ncbi:phage holin family protein [Corynebacterium renale]|uniref:Putative membrane protein n=1 Tax=Corynebacterium renale TaxID=1724 RepID=A0A2A9DLU4_9CORY|nr:phage holin family protein [Corynebacterium renale]PFG27573.1 putative membrane protein [Corynebacterium renale]SQI23100.1 membrane protein [Corynebacterium renale]
MRFLWNLLINAAGMGVALYVVVAFVPGVALETAGTDVHPAWVFLGAGLVFALVNMLVRPIVRVVSLPLNILTLGLFALVMNAGMFWLQAWAARAAGIGLDVTTVRAAFTGAIAMGLVGWVIGPLARVLRR